MTSSNNLYENALEYSPTPTLVWDKNFNIRFVNQSAVTLFDAGDKSEIVNNFQIFSPEIQLNLLNSNLVYKEKITDVFNKGKEEFLWTHQTLNKKQIFCNIILRKVKDYEKDEEVIIAFIESLNQDIIGYAKDERIENYFANVLSKNTLVESVFDTLEETAYYWDLRTGLVTFYGTKGYINSVIGDRTVRFPEFFYENKLVYHEDEEIFKKLISNVKAGIKSSYDVRFNRVSEDAAIYYRIRQNILFDKTNLPVASVGFISDINAEKNLEIKARTDLLTGCNNKITAETDIANYISKNADKNSVLYIVDIDNFKAVNDNLGHHFGDVVLREIAGKLKNCFRQNDIIGRIGGDEFLILAKDLNDDRIIINKAENILKAFANEYKGDNTSYKVSGSIGVARFPQDGTHFEDLYKAADKALYQSKLKGKDCYTIYSETLVDGTMRSHTILENAGRVADSYFDSDIITDVFELLFETQNIDLSINMALKRIGQRYNADRSYIFESFNAGSTYDNTYEWCKAGINPEIDGLKDITAEMLDDFFKFADKEGIVYSNDLSVLKAEGAFDLMDGQDIKSFLHAQIKENDSERVRLFLGLDDCVSPRVWSPKEINSLKYLSKIISIFLSFKKQK